jgi:hypothetical protein
MPETEAILRNRDIVNGLGQRDSTYAMLMQLEMPECLRALEQMATTHIGCWRDVRAFIRHFERNAPNHPACAALIQGCVRMTNAQLRKDILASKGSASLAAKWVPREPKCRGSPLMMWYYDALAHDMFPGAPDAKRRYRQLISWLSPPKPSSSSSLSWFVKQAETASNEAVAQELNAQWQQHLTRHRTMRVIPTIPVLSLAHTMGAGHNNCLHAGIGLALHVAALSCNRIITFSSQAEWHVLEDDFVKQAQHLLRTARSAVNGLNANLESVASAVATLALPATMLVIGDMEHDDPPPQFNCMTWNVSRNGRPATFHGETP